MALKIRLRPQGRTNHPFYRLVVAEATTRRNGKYVESVGWYDPFIEDVSKGINIKEERLQHWLDQGAQLSEKAEALVGRSVPKIIEGLRQKEAAKKAKARAKRKAAREKAASSK